MKERKNRKKESDLSIDASKGDSDGSSNATAIKGP